MGRKEKLVERFLRLPNDFTFEEMVTLLAGFDYEVRNKGATSGSRIRFYNHKDGDYIDIHKPHPQSTMKMWMMREIYRHLKSKGVV